MLASWKRQTLRIPLVVSMTMDSSLQEQCCLPTMPGLTIILRDGKLSQFEHFKHLSALGFTNATWLLFTDDDDIWHPTRAETYYDAILAGERDGSHAAYAVCKTIPDAHVDAPIATVEDVMALFASGALMPRTEDTETYTEALGNYVEYAVHLSTLRNFVNNAAPAILRHPYCDMGFVRYLRVGHNHPILRIVSAHWLYYYRYDMAIGQACLRVDNGELS
ncbi:hypothetical protein WJX72_004898 [[Myrmecia] bisecta]|uniref:Uncharacterized protein n=1 Tax=[Myrmecia] bisecta TaxID=41462 RepID=A0AAW1P686_9CHLO